MTAAPVAGGRPAGGTCRKGGIGVHMGLVMYRRWAGLVAGVWLWSKVLDEFAGYNLLRPGRELTVESPLWGEL